MGITPKKVIARSGKVILKVPKLSYLAYYYCTLDSLITLL